jgi:hypothetical protein
MSEYSDQYKIHETEADRARQHGVLQQFAERFGLEFTETTEKERSPFDARIFKDGAYFAVTDAKCRKSPYGQYPTFTVDVDKVDTLIKQAVLDEVRAFLLVSFNGDVRYLNLSKIAASWDSDDFLFPIAVQKRNDRDELPDRVYHIPLNLFKKVEKANE